MFSELCPICGTRMQRGNDQVANVQTEEWCRCPNGCCGYEFETGMTRLWVNAQDWTFGYQSDNATIQNIIGEANAALAVAVEEGSEV